MAVEASAEGRGVPSEALGVDYPHIAAFTADVAPAVLAAVAIGMIDGPLAVR
jgi:hypothetical protein